MSMLIVGGSGFIGTALTRNFLDRGFDVVSLDVKPSPVSDDTVRSFTVDVLDYEGLLSMFEAHRPTAVVNLAYMLGAESDETPDKALSVNCVGMDNVLRAAGEAQVSRVVYASSVSVYGTPDNYESQVTEETVPPAAYADYPSMFYNATNQLNEYQGRLYRDKFGYSMVAIRPSMVFGPGRGGGLNAWIANFVRNPLAGKAGFIPYVADRTLSLVYVDDVAQLFAETATVPEPTHHAYNTGGVKITAGALARLVEDELGGTVRCADEPSEELHPLIVSSETNDRASEEFNYDLTPLRKAIKRYAAAVSVEQGNGNQ